MSEAVQDSPSCFPSGGVVGALGSNLVARRQVTTDRIIPPGVELTRRMAMALRLSAGGKMYSSNSVAIPAVPSCQSV